MSDISIVTPRRSLQAYLRTPLGEGPWPGAVVLHDAVGQTDASRDQVDWLAASGYLAVAPDLFSWGRKWTCLRATARDLQRRSGPAFDDIEAVRTALAERDDCTGRVAVIGFCLGGGFALILAARPGFEAASVNYGPVPSDVEALLAGACPVVGSFGGRDYTLKNAAPRLRTALRANGVDHDVVEYPDAGHSFLEAHSGVTGWIMARIGMRWHDQSARDARAHILDFFDRHLKQH